MQFDCLTLENLGFGNVDNPNATDASIIAATNLWFFNATRCVI